MHKSKCEWTIFSNVIWRSNIFTMAEIRKQYQNYVYHQNILLLLSIILY